MKILNTDRRRIAKAYPGAGCPLRAVVVFIK